MLYIYIVYIYRYNVKYFYMLCEYYTENVIYLYLIYELYIYIYICYFYNQKYFFRMDIFVTTAYWCFSLLGISTPLFPPSLSGH
jgi:hypothetical protein